MFTIELIIMKRPVEVSTVELIEILDRYLQTEGAINYAIKIVGYPGVGKSAIVEQVAKKHNYYYIDTRLAFKENVDLGGYPVPDNNLKRMIYFRPRFIPPETVPEGYNGILWFLDEANRAHPTVIQTLFQIITERMCGEHILPPKTAIVLAGNLGDSDNTVITDFDDSALDGRLAVFNLIPDASNWLQWAIEEGIHPAVIQYISTYPDRLWDSSAVNPNPRGWHQVSDTLYKAYNFQTEEQFRIYLLNNDYKVLQKIIISLIGDVAGTDFILQYVSPRAISSNDILAGDEKKLQQLIDNTIPTEDILWAVNGAIHILYTENVKRSGSPDEQLLKKLSHFLKFISFTRADTRVSFMYSLVRDCGLFTQIPDALNYIDNPEEKQSIMEKVQVFLDV
ncbi:MAG: hypothetical protein Kow00102_15450 [Spirochaetota bacterium]